MNDEILNHLAEADIVIEPMYSATNGKPEFVYFSIKANGLQGRYYPETFGNPGILVTTGNNPEISEVFRQYGIKVFVEQLL